MKARGKREAGRPWWPDIKTVPALKARNTRASISALQASTALLLYFTRGHALRSASSLPMAFIFSAVGAPLRACPWPFIFRAVGAPVRHDENQKVHQDEPDG